MMNVNIVKPESSNVTIGKYISNMLLNNYKKGLAIANEEIAEENGLADSVGMVDPSQTVRMRKQKEQTMRGPILSKGYKLKPVNATGVTKTSNILATQQAKEFITQSKVLDNELDHVIAHMKLNNKDEFYENALTGNTDPELHKQIVGDYVASKSTQPEVSDDRNSS